MSEQQAKRPRRDKGEGSVYQRADGQWTAQLNLGWRDGVRRRKTVYGRTKKEVVRKLDKVKREYAIHGDIPTASMTLEQWMAIWLREVAPRTGTPNKMRGYRDKSKNYIIPAIGRSRLDKLTPRHARMLADYVTKTRGLSTTTAHNAHRVLSVALNDAMREGVATRNVAAIVSAPPPSPSGRDAFTLPEAQKLGHSIDGTRMEARWLLALIYGARKGECLGLRWSHVDLDGGVLDLAWQLQRIQYRHGCGEQNRDDSWPCGRPRGAHCLSRELDVRPDFEYTRLDGNLCLYRPKSARSVRVLPIIGPMDVALRRRHAAYLKEREEPGYVDHDLVWSRLDGRPIDAWEDGDAWTETLKAAGVEHQPLHSARHTAATLLQALGVDEATRMMILGHSSATMARLYAHRDLTLQRKALEALGQRLSIEG